jgi:GT2 family glycosyltransferase/glycosyltransferase involved in cell wall biosynthesis/Flp pilus assembly protein TadD
MTDRAQPHILLLQLEFPTWAQARAWTYPACFGVAEGLRAAGARCTTVPLLANAPLTPDAWLAHAREAVSGKQFDQVWVWLVHSPLAPSVLDWISGLAPVRVGIVMESLTYDEADYAWAGHLRRRMQTVADQSRVLTHVLVPDERDVERLAELAGVRTLWWPTMVPDRFIVPADAPPRSRKGVFHGHPYGPRQAWVSHGNLQSRLAFIGPGAPPTRYHALFDQLQSAALKRLAGPAGMTSQHMADYASMLQEVREGEFKEWMTQLPQWAAIVNLPSLAKFYGGRVYEGIAAGRPVLTYPVPDHPLNNALFVDGEEIFVFPSDSPDSLAACLDRVLGDTSLAEQVARNAQRKLRRYHTSEVRLTQTLGWLESAEEPDYGVDGLGKQTNAFGFHQSSLRLHPLTQPATTVFVLTVDDPAFPACTAAVEAQQEIAFKLEIIRNVCPFSAAAQKMITDCSTDFFIQVDEDMMLNPDAVASMEAVMQAAPDEVGMICFHLFDDDRGMPIHGIKIYRTALMKELSFQDLKASEMDLLEQMGRRGIKWILHPDVKGRHGTTYTPATIYRRYKTMYEKDIRQWNILMPDIRRKAELFRQTGDPLQLFALLGAAHGIIEAPHAEDREKDARRYDLPELKVFTRLFTGPSPEPQPYDPEKSGRAIGNPPIPLDQVRWNRARVNDQATAPTVPELTPAVSPNSSQEKSVLIVTPHFWPSVGGVERMAEDLGVGLLEQGYRVDIAAYPNPHRRAHSHRGLNIITLSPHDRQMGTVHACALEVERLVGSCRYAACVLLGATVNTLFYSACTGPLPNGTNLIFQPTMNREICDMLSGMSHAVELIVRLAARANSLVVLSEKGCDASFFAEHGIKTTYLPNGTQAIPPSGDFRKEHGIGSDTFVILHVANLYPVKNHLGLLDAFAEMPARAKLVMIGHPTDDAAYVAQVRQALAGRPEVLYIPGLSSEGIAAAMRAADLLVLPSLAEASPLCLLEAMSHRLPWITTPHCDAAHERAGGVVVPLRDFSRAARLLMRESGLRRDLGATGYAHWQACHQWSDVLEGWIELIKTGRLTRSFAMPVDIAERTVAQRRRFLALLEGADGSSNGQPTSAAAPGRGRHATGYFEMRTSEGSMDSDKFYVNLFVNQPAWSTPHPNADESARWSKIAAFLEHILRRTRQSELGKQLRMIEVGCGRGWLTNLASMYGTCEGIEPVAGVIEHARRLFPHLTFDACTADRVLRRADFKPYDVVLCSEVIEHVPYQEKSAFIAQLAELLTQGGFLVMTTPRGEMWEEWKAIAPPNQPVEDWVTETQLRDLFTSQGLSPLGLERIHVEIPNLRYVPAPSPADFHSRKLVPIYQVWVCQRLVDRTTLSFNRPPKVSVVVPTYNRPDRLGEALASVLTQTYQDLEIIVVNDGGLDAETTVAALNDGRITYIKHDRNRGLAASRNTGLRAAKGQYIAYLDDDDRYLPDHLETLVTCLEQSDYKAAYTDAWRVHERLEGGRHVETGRDLPYSHEFNPANLLISNYFPVLCVMHERSCIDEVGNFDESLFAHEDWDLWIRMATKFPFKHLTRTTAEFSWRTDGSSMTSGTQETYWRTTEIIYRKYRPYVEGIPALLEAQRQRLEQLRPKSECCTYECSIIIPVCNNMDLTKQCLESLAEVTTGPTYEVIVVDNGSTDGTAQLLQTLGGDVQVVRNPDNFGFAKACNQGAAVARGKYLVFLNNDTIPQRGWLSAMVEEAETHAETGIVGSKLLFLDRTIQHAGVVFDRDSLMPYHCYKGFESDHPAVNRRREFGAVTAACMLVRREIFHAVGGFDEEYRNGFEDVDLCLKVRDKGWKVVYQPSSLLFHLEGKTPGRKQHDQQNADRFFERWGDRWWLADEDFVYVGDGYKAVSVMRDGRAAADLHLLDILSDAASWKLVADVQRAAARQDHSAVKRLLEDPARLPGDPSVLKWAAEVCGRIGAPSLRLSYLRKVLEVGESPKVRCILARTALDQGNLSEAEQHLHRVSAVQPNHGEGLLLRGILHMQRARHRDAVAAFTSALANGADCRKCRMGIGMASMGASNPDQAWQEFSKILEDNPDDADAVHWLLRAGTALQRWNELASRLGTYVGRNPGDLSVRFALAGVLVRAEQLDAARREYVALQALAPTYDGLSELGQAIAEKESAIAGTPART